jgi:hypothetical protein
MENKSGTERINRIEGGNEYINTKEGELKREEKENVLLR